MDVAKWEMEDKAAAVEIDGILAFAIPAVVREKWPTLEAAVFKAVMDWSEKE